MKKAYKSILLLAALFTIVGCKTTQTAQETIDAVTQKVDAKNFTINCKNAYPQRGGIIDLDGGYTLRIHNDSAFAYLPYIGVVTSGPVFGDDNGVKFSEPMQNYEMKKNKNGDKWDINFSVRSLTSLYKITLSIFDNGNASFVITSPQRDAISYTGYIE